MYILIGNLLRNIIYIINPFKLIILISDIILFDEMSYSVFLKMCEQELFYD